MVIFNSYVKLPEGTKEDINYTITKRMLLFFKSFFVVFQPGAAFLAICCILELKSVFCMHFGARISHLRAHLAFGFWLLALASLGLWLMAFGFWFWFHLALVLAVHFTWLLAFVGL